MKVELKKVDAIKRELKIEIPQDRVSQKLEEIYDGLSKSAKLKGFRKGKVPKEMVKKHYGFVAQEEMIKQLIPEAYQEGIDKEKLSPVDMPEICDVALKDGKVSFTAKLEIRPEVKIKDYKGIKVKRKSNEVTEEDIGKTLEYFKKGQGKDDKVEVNDEFAKGLGYPGLEEFKNTLKQQMTLEKDRQNRLDVENQIIEFLLKKVKISAPQSLVNRQLAQRVQEWRNQMKNYKMPEAEIVKKEEKVQKDLLAAIERDIKVYFILEKIAEEESFKFEQGDNMPAKVMEFLLKEANWEGK